MRNPTAEQIEALKAEWTDQFVRANPARPELRRFGDRIGRVITVNWSGKALVDFQDGGWYDIAASAANLIKVDPAEAKEKYDPTNNSNRAKPERQS
jgi:hypothetical protein